MDGGPPPRSGIKRPFLDDNGGGGGGNKAPMQKRVRFPKGKKVKPGDETATRTSVVPEEKGSGDFARVSAKERAERSQMTTELFC